MAFFKQNDNSIYEKALSWFWVVLFISAVLYLRGLLNDMHTETTRLSEERDRFRSQVRDIQDENDEFHKEFGAAVERALKNFRDGIVEREK